MGVSPEDLGSLCVKVWRMKYIERERTNEETRADYETWKVELAKWNRPKKSGTTKTEKDGKSGCEHKKSVVDKRNGRVWTDKVGEAPHANRIDLESYKKDGITHKMRYCSPTIFLADTDDAASSEGLQQKQKRPLLLVHKNQNTFVVHGLLLAKTSLPRHKLSLTIGPQASFDLRPCQK
jgi:hypothetical protein